MTINRPSVMQYLPMGASFSDKCALGLFGLVAPMINDADGCRLRRLSRFVPKMWLRPKHLNGLSLLIDPTDWSQTVIFDEIFLCGGYDLDKVRFSPQLIVDCGAHIGMFTLLAKSRFPDAKLIAYEPNRANAGFVRSQIAKNHLNAVFVDSAVSTESGDLAFHASSNSHAGRLIHESPEQSRTASSAYTVRAINFPAALEEARPESLLLKMDIEGEERELLPAVMPLLPRRTALFFETHFGAAGWKEIDLLLTANGFHVENINARGLYYDGFACRI